MTNKSLRSWRRLALIVAVALLACVGLGKPASATSYQFESKYVSVSGPPSTTFRYDFSGYAPAINNVGQVAFFASRSGMLQPTVQGLWRGDGGPLTYLTDGFEPYLFAMNNLGEVAYARGGGIYKTLDGTPTPIATGSDFHNINDTPVGESPVQINDAGMVVFNAIPNVGPQQQTAYVSNGGPAIAIAPSEVAQAINNLGVVAVSNALFTEIIGIPPVGPTTVLATLPPHFAAIGFPEMNDSGDLIAAVYDGGFAIYKFEQGVPQFLTRSGGYTYDINNAGDVAFAAGFGGVGGIYTGTNPAADFVIRVGDPLFGSTLTGYSFGSDGLNDLGQVAFYYALANGRSGIAIATPVPEPATSVLAAASLVAIGMVSLRQSRRSQWSRALV
jgi:hypothetical protein